MATGHEQPQQKYEQPQQPSQPPSYQQPQQPPMTGSATAPPSREVGRPRVRKLAIAVVVISSVMLVVRLAFPLVARAVSGSLSQGAGGRSSSAMHLVTFLFSGVNIVVGIALVILAILIIVHGRGRARTGGIIVLAVLVLGVVLRWVIDGIQFVVITALLRDSSISSVETVGLVFLIVTLLRHVVEFAVILFGAMKTLRATREAPSVSPAEDSPAPSDPAAPSA